MPRSLWWRSQVIVFLTVGVSWCGPSAVAQKVDATSPVPRSIGPSPWKLREGQRRLVGDGQHRALHTELVLVGSTDNLPFINSGGCEAVLVENLPRGIFADRFELQRLASDGVVPEIEVIGDVDIESPAPMCNGTVLLVRPKLEHLPPGIASASQVARGGGGAGGSVGSSEDDAALLLQASVSVPLHSRYPAPMSQRASSWRSWWGGEFDIIIVPAPSLLVRCQPVREECQRGQECQSTSEGWREIEWPLSEDPALAWRIPAGNPAHATAVALFTGLASLLGAGILIFQTISQSIT